MGLIVGVAGVTVMAAQIAAGQPDKDAGQTGIGGLTLDGIEKLGDVEGPLQNRLCIFDHIVTVFMDTIVELSIS